MGSASYIKKESEARNMHKQATLRTMDLNSDTNFFECGIANCLFVHNQLQIVRLNSFVSATVDLHINMHTALHLNVWPHFCGYHF